MWPKQWFEIKAWDSKRAWFLTENESAPDGITALEIRKGDKQTSRLQQPKRKSRPLHEDQEWPQPCPVEVSWALKATQSERKVWEELHWISTEDDLDIQRDEGVHVPAFDYIDAYEYDW